MKFYLYFCILSLFLLSATCKNGSSGKLIPGKIQGELAGCQTDSLRLFGWNGIMLDQLEVSPLKETNNNSRKFSFDSKTLPSGLYFIGTNQKNVRPFLIHDENSISILGHCDSIKTLRFLNNKMDDEYQAMMSKSAQFQSEFQGLIAQYRRAKGKANVVAELDAKMADLDKRKLAFFEETKKQNAFISKILALNTYLSFQGSDKKLESEGQHFAQNFFQLADFSDPDYNNLPQMMQAGQSYSQTLGQVGLSIEDQANSIDALLNKMPEGTAYQSFLLGIALGYGKSKAEQNLVKYTELYLDKFGGQNQQLEEMLNGSLRKAKKLMVGVVAPDIALNNPDGKEKKLSDYRGKIVLIDFWASWCGPCRRENPNVVKVYDKYHDKGFEIFGVSLDKKEDRWVAAIEKDGLTWEQVSDLKGWSSGAAKDYGVSSIPQTFLIDQEGKIIAKNLRGPALEAKLAQLFD